MTIDSATTPVSAATPATESSTVFSVSPAPTWAPAEHPPLDDPSSQSLNRPWIFRKPGRIISIVFLLLFVWLTYKAVRVGLYGRIIYQNGLALMQLSNGGSDELIANLPVIEERLERVSAAMDGLVRETRPFAPMLNDLGWVPTYGPTLAALPEFLIVGQESLGMAQEGVAFVIPTLAGTASPADRSQLIAALMTALPNAPEAFDIMAQHAEQANAVLATVPAAELHPRLADKVSLAQDGLSALPALLRMAPQLPDLVGMDGPRTYLLLVQNNDELRATGGFVTALGRVTLEDAAIADLKFTDSTRIMRNDIEYGWAPEPMRRYMGIELMVLRDANWSPDFPTTAQAMRSLYAQETGTMVDGIITVDLHAVEQIVAGLGALKLADVEQPLTSDTIVAQVKEMWTQPVESGDTIDSVGLNKWWGQRKNFIPALVDAAMRRMQNGNVEYVALAQSGLKALDNRSIQVWMNNDLVQAEISHMAWDGGLHPEENKDFIAWVDSNLGYNKVDAAIERSLAYTIDWSAGNDSPGLATITMTYRHPTAVDDHTCDNTPRYGSTYDDMTLRCYFNYVRLYVPKGSELISATGVDADSTGSQRGEKGLQIFSGYFIMEPGQETQVSFHYRLPETLTERGYGLLMQRQSGTNPLPVSLDVDGELVRTTLDEGWMSIQ